MQSIPRCGRNHALRHATLQFIRQRLGQLSVTAHFSNIGQLNRITPRQLSEKLIGNHSKYHPPHRQNPRKFQINEIRFLILLFNYLIIKPTNKPSHVFATLRPRHQKNHSTHLHQLRPFPTQPINQQSPHMNHPEYNTTTSNTTQPFNTLKRFIHQ